MEGDVPGAEADLGADPVDARDVGVGDELDGTVAGHEVAELVDRPRLDVDARGREQDAVDVARPRVGDLLVERLPLPVQRVELVLGPGERPVGARDALPGGLGVDVEEDGEGARGEERPGSLGEHGAAAECQYDRLAARQHVVRDLLLERAEACLATRREQLRDRSARALLDLLVEIEERPPDPCRPPPRPRASSRSP